MLTDTLLYYRPNIEGMYGKVNWNWGNQNVFIDWISRQTETNREIFTAGTSGEIYYKNLFIENYILMTHVAQAMIRIPGKTVEDYLGFVVQGGIKTSEKAKITGFLKAGILESTYRDRALSDGFINEISFFAEATGRYRNFGIKSVLNSGAGHKFKYGDLFYRAKNYLRTDVIWYFINHDKVKGTFNLSFHIIDWNDLDQQQQLSVIYVFGK
jgi:hypothetical protein